MCVALEIIFSQKIKFYTGLNNIYYNKEIKFKHFKNPPEIFHLLLKSNCSNNLDILVFFFQAYTKPKSHTDFKKK